MREEEHYDAPRKLVGDQRRGRTNYQEKEAARRHNTIRKTATHRRTARHTAPSVSVLLLIPEFCPREQTQRLTLNKSTLLV